MCIRRLQICADIINSGYKYQVSSIKYWLEIHSFTDNIQQ
jgi:hypothetical protein